MDLLSPKANQKEKTRKVGKNSLDAEKQRVNAGQACSISIIAAILSWMSLEGTQARKEEEHRCKEKHKKQV